MKKAKKGLLNKEMWLKIMKIKTKKELEYKYFGISL